MHIRFDFYYLLITLACIKATQLYLLIANLVATRLPMQPQYLVHGTLLQNTLALALGSSVPNGNLNH